MAGTGGAGVVIALRDRITIQQLVSGQDSYGQPIDVWQDVVTTWARVEDLSGREYFAAQQVPTSQITTRVTIRWRNDIKPYMRIIHGSRIYDIQSVPDPGGKKKYCQIMCKEVIP